MRQNNKGLYTESKSWFYIGTANDGVGVTDAEHRIAKVDGEVYQYELLLDPASDYVRMGIEKGEKMGPDVIERLARIETTLSNLAKGYPKLEDKINQMSNDVTLALDSTKSAHHRIDEFKRDVCWTIGISMTACGFFSSILTWALGR